MEIIELKDIGLFGKHQPNATGKLTISEIHAPGLYPSHVKKEAELVISVTGIDPNASFAKFVSLHGWFTGKNLVFSFLVRSNEEPWIQYKGNATLTESTIPNNGTETLKLLVHGEPEKIIDTRMMPSYDLTLSAEEVEYVKSLLGTSSPHDLKKSVYKKITSANQHWN